MGQSECDGERKGKMYNKIEYAWNGVHEQEIRCK